MANATIMEDEENAICAQEEYAAVHSSINSEDILNSFSDLEVEETRLTEQKKHLKALLNQLETKAKEEFEKRKRKVSRLNSEVSDLKRKCEKYAKWLNSESTSEESQVEP
jgi:myosin heavy subunit